MMSRWVLSFFLWAVGFYAAGQSAKWSFQASIDSLLAAHPASPDEPGFAVCIVDDGGIVYERQYGLSDVARHKPMTATTSFNIGSITKQFTAAAILLLEEQGKLRRTDDIRRYIPELPDLGYAITINHLIAHTSGIHSLPEVVSMSGKVSNKKMTLDYLLKWLQKNPVLAFRPGTDFSYSNSAYMLLLCIVERASGMSAEAYMTLQIFEPLGMKSAKLALRESDGMPEGHPSYYLIKNGKKFKKSGSYFNALGATGLHCNLRDLALWQLNFEHNKLGKEGQAFISKMETSYALDNGASTHYGAGLILKNYHDLPVVEHSGGWNGFLIQCRRFPKERLSVIVASNNDKHSPFVLTDLICDQIFSYKKDTTTTASGMASLPIDPNALVGTFLSDRNAVRYVKRSGDTLWISSRNSPQKRIVLQYDPTSLSDTAIVFKEAKTGIPVQFVYDKAKKIRGMHWEGGGYFVVRRFYEKLQPPTGVKFQYAGRYSADYFGRKLTIRQHRKSGKFFVKPVFFMKYRLEQLSDSIFAVRDQDVIFRFSGDKVAIGDHWVSNIWLRRTR